MVMVLAASLFLQSLRNIGAVEPGFDRHGVLVMELFAQPGRQVSSNPAAYYREIVDRVCRLPGVVSASFSTIGPVNRFEFKTAVAVNGSIEPPEQAVVDILGPGFFRMIGMRVLAGREFQWSDDEQAAPVAVISQSLAARLFPGRDPIGQIVGMPGFNQKRLRVVGVVNSASLWRIQSRDPAAIYTPLLQAGPTGSTLDIRVAGDRSTTAVAAGKIVEGLGHDYALYTETLEHRINKMTAEERIVTWLATFFGGLALLLALIGLYGLMSYSVTQRTPEIGVRMALGAERANVIRLVLREVAMLVSVGILIGVPTAIGASKLISGMLFEVSATDPLSIGASVTALLAVSLLAGYLPARHASRIDPITALRVN